jgi:hypothetical protein
MSFYAVSSHTPQDKFQSGLQGLAKEQKSNPLLYEQVNTILKFMKGRGLEMVVPETFKHLCKFQSKGNCYREFSCLFAHTTALKIATHLNDNLSYKFRSCKKDNSCDQHENDMCEFRHPGDPFFLMPQENFQFGLQYLAKELKSYSLHDQVNAILKVMKSRDLQLSVPKTFKRLCKFQLAGNCNDEFSCLFAHTTALKIATHLNENPAYKLKPCRKGKACEQHKEDMCDFKHPEDPSFRIKKEKTITPIPQLSQVKWVAKPAKKEEVKPVFLLTAYKEEEKETASFSDGSDNEIDEKFTFSAYHSISPRKEPAIQMSSQSNQSPKQKDLDFSQD